MPIKSCSRCGLKVLVDPATAASDTYLCPRCAPDAKPATAPPKPAGGKRPTIKVTCPYCGASFSGSMPSRPAKGGCPVCQKELVLLPDGTIQAAASFNLNAWQKEKKTASNPPTAPAPAAEPPELPTAVDPLGGATILDMGGPPAESPPLPPPPSLDEPTILPIGEGIGGQTMLGMGQDIPTPPPAPSIEEPAAEPPPLEDEATMPPDLGGATILDMGSRPVELPPADIEEPPPAPDLLSETMPGMDRPPVEESPVEPPIPPPIPSPMFEEPAAAEPEIPDVPTVRDSEPPPPVPEPLAESLDSAPEIPGDLGGQTILGMGGAEEIRPPEPEPSIEEHPPEAVPILAKDLGSPEAPGSEPSSPPGPETPKPYAYQPIPRVPRTGGSSITPPPPAPPTPRPNTLPSTGLPPTPSSPPVLGSDFRIAAPPEPVPLPRHDERRASSPRTSAVIMPRAHHSLKKLVVSWILLLLPAGVAYALHSMQKNPAVEKTLNQISSEVLPGIDKTRREIEKAVTVTEEPPPEGK